jgi:hypothetical protein
MPRHVALNNPDVGPEHAQNPAAKSRLGATRVMTKMIQDTDAVPQVTIGEDKKSDFSFSDKALPATAPGGATWWAASYWPVSQIRQMAKVELRHFMFMEYNLQ